MLSNRTDIDSPGRAANAIRSVDAPYRSTTQRIHRACDRCRVKKSKCNGQQPCNTCSVNERTCVFSALRRRDIRKWHCRMQDTVDEAIQRLYRACKANGCFPGVPPDKKDGYATTEDILLAMGFGNLELSPATAGLENPANLPHISTATHLDSASREPGGAHLDTRVFSNSMTDSTPNHSTMMAEPPHQPVRYHNSPAMHDSFHPSAPVTPVYMSDQAREPIAGQTGSQQLQQYHHHYQHSPSHEQAGALYNGDLQHYSAPYTPVSAACPNNFPQPPFTFDPHNSYLVSSYYVYDNASFVDARQTWHGHNELVAVQQ